MMGNKSLLFYDPMSPSLQMVSGEDYTTLVLFCLLKCAYGDSQHIQEHEDHYTSPTSGRVRRLIYQLWRKIHQMDLSQLRYSRSQVNLGLSDYLLVNNAKDPKSMSTQATGNTCYFQVWSLTQFYSLDYSKSRINVKTCVFNKRTIKVCVSCC